MKRIVWFVVTLSLVANAAMAVGLYQYASDYRELLTWACDNGNGGAECGEE